MTLCQQFLFHRHLLSLYYVPGDMSDDVKLQIKKIKFNWITMRQKCKQLQWNDLRPWEQKGEVTCSEKGQKRPYRGSEWDLKDEEKFAMQTKVRCTYGLGGHFRCRTQIERKSRKIKLHCVIIGRSWDTGCCGELNERWVCEASRSSLILEAMCHAKKLVFIW